MSRLLAFVRRDTLAATSYKMAFAWQVGTLASSILTVYFLSRMVRGGSIPALAPWGGDYFAFAIVGVAFADYLAVSLRGFSGGVRAAQMLGTLEAMLATPTSPAVIVLGSALYPLLWSLLRVGVYIGSGVALGARFPEANIPAAAATIALSVLAFGAVGMLGASLVLVLKAWEPVTAFFSGASVLLGGVLYPVSSLPGAAQAASAALPMTHAIEAMRGALLAGRGIRDLAEPLGLLAAFTALVLPVALWSFRRALHRLRIDGSAGHY